MGFICCVKENKCLILLYGLLTVLCGILGFTTLEWWSGIINFIVAVLAFRFLCFTQPEVTDLNNA